MSQVQKDSEMNDPREHWTYNQTKEKGDVSGFYRPYMLLSAGKALSVISKKTKTLIELNY